MRAGTRAGNRGHALRIEFGTEVSLPFGFGYAAHFGLGLFLPVDPQGTKPENYPPADAIAEERAAMWSMRAAQTTVSP